MKLSRILPILGTLTVFVSAPVIASAQAANPLDFHADLGRPAVSSSSSSYSESFFAAPAPAAAASASAPAAPEATGSKRPFSGLGADVKVGLAGIGFDVATPLVPTRLNVRGGATFFSYNLNTTTSDGETINGTLKLQNSGIMVDWFPWRGKFRLSGGVTVYNNKGVTASATVAGGKSFTVGNTTYYSNPSNPTVGTLGFKLGGNTGGRVSFGTGNLIPKKGRFTFQSELGIEFLSSPTVTLALANACTNATYTNCPGVSASDIAQQISKYQNDVNFVRFYPILSAGFGFRLF